MEKILQNRNMLKIPYTALSLREALYLLENHKEEGYFDASGKVVIES